VAGDLEQLFDAVRGDTMNTSLSEPDRLRGEGDRRGRVIRRAAVVAAVVAILGFSGGLAVALERPTAAPVPLVEPSPTTEVPSPSASTTPPPLRTTPSEHLTPTPAVTVCRPADLDPRPYYGTGGGGSGHVGWYIVVRNVSGTLCRLDSFPVLYDTGKPAVQEQNDPGWNPILLPPGGYATFTVYMMNGYSGLDPSAPECQHPQYYQNLSVSLDGGARFALPGLKLGFQCGDIRVSGWAVANLYDVPNPSRAP
jgi:hypothetical protein